MGTVTYVTMYGAVTSVTMYMDSYFCDHE